MVPPVVQPQLTETQLRRLVYEYLVDEGLAVAADGLRRKTKLDTASGPAPEQTLAELLGVTAYELPPLHPTSLF